MPALYDPATERLSALPDDRPDLNAPDLLGMPDVLEHGASEPFRYCLNTATLRQHKLTLPELVDIAVGAGFEAIEPWIDEIERFVAEGGDLHSLDARIRDLGLTVEGGIGFFAWIVEDADQRAAAMKDARHAMTLLSRLGGQRIAAPPFGAHAAGAARIDLIDAADRYRDLLKVGEGIGVVPLIELWGGSANVSRLCEAAMIAMHSDRPEAAILTDVYHMYKGGSPQSGLRMLSSRALPLIHINDYPAIPPADITDADRVFPGDGVAPLTSFFRDLRTIGFHGVVSLELFNPEHAAMEPLNVARTGLEKLREVVQKSFD
jgi:2-keto-myo-inositol isomerase